MVSMLNGLKGSLLPKILVGVLIIGIFFQLSWTSASRPAPVRTPAAEHEHEHEHAPIPKPAHEDAKQDWFEDAKKAGQVDDDEASPPQYFADPTTAAATADAAQATAIDYGKTIIKHGASNCLPDFGDKLRAAAVERNHTCAQYAPFPAAETRRVAFATITTGKPAEAYQRAIQSQMFAAAVHGTAVHVLCEQLSDGAWNKIAYLLNLVMNEMLKPADERLEWIMWIDRDAIVLDPCRPLSSFLPPDTPEYADVNLITNNDAFGLNAGVFLFRVGDWATDLFNTILAFRYYRPDVELVLAEQTAMEKIIREDKWTKHVTRVPWYWFNAYPDEDDSVKKYREGLETDDLEWFRARKGDFVVHFAGDDGRSGRMPDWLDMLEQVGNVYEKKEQQRDVTKEVAAFWASWKDGTLKDEQKSGEKWKVENVDNKKTEA
jgi:mannan polymerase II complex MNN10 subunit